MMPFSSEPEITTGQFFPMGVAVAEQGVHRCIECGLVNVKPGEMDFNLRDCRCSMCGHQGPSETFWKAARGDKP